MTEQAENIFIVNRPMYRIVILTNGADVMDVDIQLTAKGKQYARARARGFHRRIESEEDALAEIIHARDNWQPKRPDRAFEMSKF
jgi:hypothetical protein